MNHNDFYRRYIDMRILFVLLVIVLGIVSCTDDPIDPMDNVGDLTEVPYNPTFVAAPRPPGFPEMVVPEDNPFTEEGIELGRFLFHDPILSEDSTVSCASCHFQEGLFTDLSPVSVGINGQTGSRSAMSILNVGFYNNGLFWDGRFQTLEELVIDPVENPIEMHEDWPDIEEKLKVHPYYPDMIRKAFGINNVSEIDRSHVTKSIAQFMRTIVSQGNSKFDKVFYGDGSVIFSDEELNGYDMFFDISADLPDAECAHCHNEPLFTTNQFFNNAIQESDDGVNGFNDPGRGAITGIPFDNGKMRAPSLRNIALSAPYMHDGRFQTLEEVIDHYNSGGHPAPNVDPLIRPLGLTAQQKEELLAFLHTLTDTTFLSVEKYQNPFQ